MQSLDIEFEYNQAEEGYIYKPEEDLENEIAGYLQKLECQGGADWDEIGKEAYLQLSPLRHRLLSWYPFRRDASVLEVGAGFGALTGVLCKKAGHVTAVELKPARAGIMKKRFSDEKNLEILAGNIMDMSFGKPFDYIVVHDIFALARKYLKADNPNTAFLMHLKSLLADNGVLLLAVENRLGLKYFAGASEEYTREFFAGINSYSADERNRTMSKGELTAICRRAGFGSMKMYYPYPDLVIPQEIYTDKIFDSCYYGSIYEDRELLSGRYQFFDEKRMFRTLQRENIVENFANAFLVELSDAEKSLAHTAYARFQDDFEVFYEHGSLVYFDQGERKSYPEGQRLDAYLADLVETVADCNLGDKNPFTAQIYHVFEQVAPMLGTAQVSVSDFYVCEDRICLLQRGLRKNSADLDYARWHLVYDWYRRNIMHYRNAERRIQLAQLYKILNVHLDTAVLERYLAQWEDGCREREALYETGYYPDFIFDFDAAARGDNISFSDSRIYTGKQTEARNLLRLHSFLKEVKD